MQRASQLLEDALPQLNERPADVRKAGLLWAARVQRVSSPERAREILNAALSAHPGVQPDDQLGFQNLTLYAVAATAPELIPTLPPLPDEHMFRSMRNELARIMSEHGHKAYLRTYTLESAPLEQVSLDGVHWLITQTNDQHEVELLLNRAMGVWRIQRGTVGLLDYTLLNLLRVCRRLLDIDIIEPLFREWLDYVLQKEDMGIEGEFGDVSFISMRSITVFHAFDLLLEIDADRAFRLVDSDPELARAVQRYPEGVVSMQAEAELARANMPPCDRTKPAYFVMGGNEADMEYGYSLLDAERTKDFTKPLDFALARYREDANPRGGNYAPKPFWPSTAMYRTIFNSIGRTASDSGENQLKQVPDQDLRLFAQIELAGGLLALPPLPILMQYRPAPW